LSASQSHSQPAQLPAAVRALHRDLDRWLRLVGRGDFVEPVDDGVGAVGPADGLRSPSACCTSLGYLASRATAHRLSGRVTCSRLDALYGMGCSVRTSKRTNQEEASCSGQGWGDGANDLNGPFYMAGSCSTQASAAS
jgi:hypothetical protein